MLERLRVGIGGLAKTAPIPPLALRGEEVRIAGLGDGGIENIKTADVVRLTGDFAEPFVEASRIPASELGDGADAKQMEVPKHGRADRYQ